MDMLMGQVVQPTGELQVMVVQVKVVVVVLVLEQLLFMLMVC
jgi:hypothetical protein